MVEDGALNSGLTCPSCGADNAPEMKFCNSCGHDLRAIESDEEVLASSGGIHEEMPAEEGAQHSVTGSNVVENGVSEPKGDVSDTKECPFCAETIKAAATRCRYCGADFSDPDPYKAVRAVGAGAGTIVGDVFSWLEKVISAVFRSWMRASWTKRGVIVLIPVVIIGLLQWDQWRTDQENIKGCMSMHHYEKSFDWTREQLPSGDYAYFKDGEIQNLDPGTNLVDTKKNSRSWCKDMLNDWDRMVAMDHQTQDDGNPFSQLDENLIEPYSGN